MNTQTDTQTQNSSNPALMAPTVTAVVTHRVADYDAWKAAFDQHAEARRSAGVIAHHINRDTDDPNLVSIYLAGADRSKLEAFFGSDDLKSTMANAGVEGAPTITLMEPVEDQTQKRDPLYGMIVVHPVADFDSWKKVYDQVDALRREHGIIGHAVNRSIADSNLVIVYHQAETLEALRAFASSPELENAMESAGVAGPPKFSFHVGAGWGN
jgi:quinol monooxygenase YgiN